ncbi:hypothetical protein E4U55_007235 [Claviceps digitariae]|nr:hypothetical protein E4U55_007235 [Claviceps digitariae]
MTTTINLDHDAIAQSGLADYEHHGLPTTNPPKGSMDIHAVRKPSLRNHDVTLTSTNTSTTPHDDDDNDSHYEGKPTDHELKTLPRVSGKIMWAMWTIAFVELCERFSYYGSAVLYTNFVNHPLPAGSTTGADPSPNGKPGALGMGPKAAQGISLFNQFFAYLMPLVG